MRILILDGQTLLAEALAHSLTAHGHEILGIVRGLEEARKLLDEETVDLVILGASLPDNDGPETLQDIGQSWPSMPIVVLSVSDDHYRCTQAQQLGAMGYLTTSVGEQTLLAALAAVARGEKWFPGLSANGRTRHSRLDMRIRLTFRQHQVLCRVAHGFGYKEIASNLGLSRATVDGHVRRLHRLFAVRTNTELVRKAMEHGFLAAADEMPMEKCKRWR